MAFDKLDEAGREMKKRYEKIHVALSKNSGWKARLQAYWTLGTEDEAAVPVLKQITDLDLERARVDEIDEAIKAVRELQKKIRPGGCQDALEHLQEWVRAQRDALKSAEAIKVKLSGCSSWDEAFASEKVQEFRQTVVRAIHWLIRRRCGERC